MYVKTIDFDVGIVVLQLDWRPAVLWKKWSLPFCEKNDRRKTWNRG